MKKILLLSILSLVSVGFVQPYTVTKNIDEEKVVGFEEYASDELNKYAVNLSNKNSVVGNDETIDVSPIFVQHGYLSEENQDLLRFAVAIKGDISSVSFLRGEVYGKQGTSTKEVTTLYKAISSNGSTYYYDGENKSLSTDESLAGQYFWACYTIGYADKNFGFRNIPLSVSVNDEIMGEKKVSLEEVKYGIHEHDYSEQAHNPKHHYNVCSLCLTADETSYEEHNYSVSVNKEYTVASTIKNTDFNVSVDCDCDITPTVTLVNAPEKGARLGEKVTLDINGTQKQVGLTVKETFTTYSNENSSWKSTHTGKSDAKITYVGDSNNFLKLDRAKDNEKATTYVHTSDFVAPEGDFEMTFEARSAAKSLGNHSEVTIVKGSEYKVSVVFETDVEKNPTVFKVSTNYKNIDNKVAWINIGDYNFHTYRVAVTKGDNGKYTYDVYMDNKLLFENVPATPVSNNETDMIKIGVAEELTASYCLYFAIKYLKVSY